MDLYNFEFINTNKAGDWTIILSRIFNEKIILNILYVMNILVVPLFFILKSFYKDNIVKKDQEVCWLKVISLSVVGGVLFYLLFQEDSRLDHGNNTWPLNAVLFIYSSISLLFIKLNFQKNFIKVGTCLIVFLVTFSGFFYILTYHFKDYKHSRDMDYVSSYEQSKCDFNLNGINIEGVKIPIRTSVTKSGVNSKLFLHGLEPPSESVGVEGNYFFDSADFILYGPKTSSGWKKKEFLGDRYFVYLNKIIKDKDNCY